MSNRYQFFIISDDEDENVVIRFNDLHYDSIGFMKYNSKTEEWQPYGRWEKYIDGQLVLVLKYDENGCIDYEDWLSEEGDLIDIPDIDELLSLEILL